MVIEKHGMIVVMCTRIQQYMYENNVNNTQFLEISFVSSPNRPLCHPLRS